MLFYKNNFTNYPNIGPKIEEALERLNIKSPYDLLFHFPNNLKHKLLYPALHSVQLGDLVILKVKIIDIDILKNAHNSRKKPFTIYCQNSTGKIDLIYFNYYPQYVLNWAKIGSEIIVIGKIDLYNNLKKIAHPEILNPLTPNLKLDRNEIIYPLTYSITSKQLHKYVAPVIASLDTLEEWIEDRLLKENDWDSFTYSLKKIHNPSDLEYLSPYSVYRMRIAYDELLANQLMVNLLRRYKEQHRGREIISSGFFVKTFLSSLPFIPTSQQKQAIDEIITDQQSNKKMSRLLQGDVGSGKTIVAYAAILHTIESRSQAVLMAPTDVLATQLYSNFNKLCSHLPIKYSLLTGKTKLKEKKKLLEELSNGDIQLLIGTHAVFQDKVIFKDLALVIIDEQHRFGVEQRVALLNKGNEADLLIMSATPIPRTLSLALYGDMDITQISEKPKSRIPIKTSIISQSKISQVIHSLDKILQEGGKIYWVCSLVTEAEKEESYTKKMSAELRMQELSKIYPGIVGLVHGQLENNLKQQNLDKFINGEYKILVATTVIEVGVDVPDATVIIIENAESFGLSQLHQLRGRVGRGTKASHCILLYSNTISKTAWNRLKILKSSEDGFLLAEEDLKLRGSGDIIGTKQSGLPNFKTVDFIAHHHLISLANQQAKNILAKDPTLSLASSKKYHDLLTIFNLDYKNLYL